MHSRSKADHWNGREYELKYLCLITFGFTNQNALKSAVDFVIYLENTPTGAKSSNQIIFLIRINCCIRQDAIDLYEFLIERGEKH